jgi:RND family efflux transporter MFP subunit
MSRRRRFFGILVLFILGVGAGIAGDRLWRSKTASTEPAAGKPAAGNDEEEPEPAAVVRTVIANDGELSKTIDSLGAASVPPAAIFIESWPTDVLITRLLVQPGEAVAKDAPLAQITPTRDAETQFAAAQLALDSATKSLDIAQQRLNQGLATRTDVVTAQASRDEARQRLDRLQTGRPPTDGLLHAHTAGTVGAVRVQPGATVTAGSPILEINADSIVAQVGLDPVDAAGVASGQTFDVRPIDDRAPGHWKGTVTLLGRTVNPTSRLIDATLALEGDALPRAGTPLRARAALAGVRGVIIPRAALVPDENAMVVFIVKDGTALRSVVTIAQSGREQVAVSSGCTAGDHIIVSAQDQLTPGATVREVAAPGSPELRSGGDGAHR